MVSEQASGLHEGSAMKSLTVGILAAIALAGCGVGFDDPEGQAAASGAGLASSAQQLTQAESAGAPPQVQDIGPGLGPQTPGTAAVRPDPLDPAPRGLPQDPVPLWTGRPDGPLPPIPGR